MPALLVTSNSNSLQLNHSKEDSGSLMQWTPRRPAALARQDAVAALVKLRGSETTGSSVVVVGGRSMEEYSLSQVELFEWNSKRWWALPDLLQARCGCAVAAIDNTIIVAGGLGDAGALETAESFTFGSSTEWKSVAPMSIPTWYCSAVGITRHKTIVVVGGRDSSWNELDSTQAYDLDTDSWKELKPMNTKRFGCGATLISPSKILVVGGYDGKDWITSAEIYDYENDTWSDVASMPQAFRFCVATTIAQDRKFVFVSGLGGEEDERSGIIQCYNVSEDKWATLDTHSDISGCALTSVGQDLLAVGGSSESCEGISDVRSWRLSASEFNKLWGDNDNNSTTRSTHSNGSSFQRPSRMVETSAVAVQIYDVPGRRTQDGSSVDTGSHPLFAGPSVPSDSSVTRSLYSQKSSSSLGGRKKVQRVETADNFGVPVIYSGHITEITGRPHGKGKMKWKLTGDVYEGRFRGGARDGQGRMIYKNGDVFEGTFKDDQRQGRGNYRYRDGRMYDGNYIDDAAEDPQGALTWSNGTIYIGQFKESKRTGKGTIRFPSNVQYEGEFVNGKYQGHGVCKFADGSIYDGEWKSGKASGKGRLVNVRGEVIHDGDWKDDGPVYE